MINGSGQRREWVRETVNKKKRNYVNKNWKVA